MINANAKQEYRKRPYTDFITPVLMYLGLPESRNKKVRKINEIEADVCEILDISDDEIYDYCDATPKITIMRSKFDLAIYEMCKENLIESVGCDIYKITDQGNAMLFS